MTPKLVFGLHTHGCKDLAIFHSVNADPYKLAAVHRLLIIIELGELQVREWGKKRKLWAEGRNEQF